MEDAEVKFEKVKSSVSLWLLGDSLDPDEVTRILKVLPTLSGRKGSRTFTRLGHIIIQKTGFWCHEVNSELSIIDGIKSVVEIFDFEHSVKQNVPQIESARCSVFWLTPKIAEKNRDVELIFPPSLLLDLGKKEIDLLVEVCVSEEEAIRE